ncbi:pectinesterase/pectinesterase inhibitor, partial [Medicago truncatula]
MDVVNGAPDSSVKMIYFIFIKKGFYNENVEVNKQNLDMIGEGMDATIITSNLSNSTDNLSTFNTTTL